MGAIELPLHVCSKALRLMSATNLSTSQLSRSNSRWRSCVFRFCALPHLVSCSMKVVICYPQDKFAGLELLRVLDRIGPFCEILGRAGSAVLAAGCREFGFAVSHRQISCIHPHQSYPCRTLQAYFGALHASKGAMAAHNDSDNDPDGGAADTSRRGTTNVGESRFRILADVKVVAVVMQIKSTSLHSDVSAGSCTIAAFNAGS